jgi:thiamine-phosphate pyrophosphorylase
MLTEMTPAVARALESAERWAGRLGAFDIGAVHLLLALLDEEEGRAATLLERASLDRLATVNHFAVDAPAISQTASELPIRDTLRQVFRQARLLARELSGEPTVSSEALLLVMLREDDALRTTLESLGLVFGELEAAVTGLHGPAVVLDEQIELEEPVEAVPTARILDAAANRSREALRVIEDYCRFARNDAFLTQQLKQLRHDLTGVLNLLAPSKDSLPSRDTPGDIGTGITTAQEQRRFTILGVVEANSKRLQEALRTIEEFAKLTSPNLARQIEQLRYRSYTLEKAIVLGSAAATRLRDARLQVLVSGASCVAALDWTIKEAAAGGARVIQLREKSLNDRALLERARRVRRWTREAGVLFIVNDRPDIARLAEADGVHLGQDEMTVADARRIVGSGAIIGVSTHDIEQLRRAILDGASYAGVGPIFASATKSFEALAGLEYLRRAAVTTDLPLFAIGGIDEKNLAQVVDAGARRIAVGHVICQADNPRETASILRQQLESAR